MYYKSVEFVISSHDYSDRNYRRKIDYSLFKLLDGGKGGDCIDEWIMAML